MPHARIAIGSLTGAMAAAAIAPLFRGLFHVPSGAIGFVTVNAYPKGFDYAVVTMLVMGAFIGGFLANRFAAGDPARVVAPDAETRKPASRSLQLITALVVFLVMCFLHDHPYALMEPFHEGEHLSPAFLLRSGKRPYRDVFFFHGLGVDGGLDALVLGDPPSPRRERRLETLLDAVALALLVPVAAEATATGLGMLAAVFVALCAIAAGQLPVFPYFRFAPIFLAALGLLRYARVRSLRWLFLAFAASSLGILLSVDTGTYALAGTAVVVLFLRPKPLGRVLVLAALAASLPFVLLIAIRADLGRFIADSFIILPRAIDAAWALPAPRTISWESARYYVPPVFYGFLLAMAWRDRRRATPILIIVILSLFVFRSAVGRCSWSHTRFGTPLLGVAIVAFVLEPLVLAKRRIIAALLAILVFVFVEVWPNTTAGAKLLAGWRARQRHEGLVPYPFATGKGIYTTQQNALDLAELNGLVVQLGGPKGTIFDLSNEQALYYLLQRKAPVRCIEPSLMGTSPIREETIAELEANPPACVILHGTPNLDQFDGVSTLTRAPEVAGWVDANYPRRVQAGRFTVAVRGSSIQGK
jgi:hypothetical protein